MKYYKEFERYEIKEVGKKKKYDNNIYTFDIESTSYYTINGVVYDSLSYDSLTDVDKKDAEPRTCMYIWQLGINDNIYYGRTWDEFKEFISIIDSYCPINKILWVHNLAFEFQFLISVLNFKDVFARKSHKPIYAKMEDFKFELRCSLMNSNAKLESLPKIYNLPIKKLTGNLDYNKIRHSKTKLTKEEMEYCEHDNLVLYEYIKHELSIYERINKIPLTSTGHVRRELMEKIRTNYKYKTRVRNSINTNPHVYNLLINAFMGGYTHANWVYANEILTDITSFDETSAYPYVMTTYKFPGTEFKKCYIKNIEDLNKNFAYLLHVKFTNVKSKFYNNIISASKCMNIRGASYDNGRIIKADEFEMVLTDVDFFLILKAYKCEFEIMESWFSLYKYLPKDLIEFILEKYVIKTTYKDVEEKQLEYNLEKQKFNSLYGSTVTNNINDLVEFKNGIWTETELSNEEIIDKLEKEKRRAFLSFSYGVWVTAYARRNLLERILDLDKFVVYADTDSIKLLPGFDIKIIEDYNKKVLSRIDFVSRQLGIEKEKYAPKDIYGKSHPLGLFEFDGFYQEFITQGAKKYAVKQDGKIKITVAGVPKKGAVAINDLNEFKDGLIFKFKDTNKNLLFYCENQDPIILKDYNGIEYLVTDSTGCCLLPNTYTLGKSLDYAMLISDESSKRAIFKE